MPTTYGLMRLVRRLIFLTHLADSFARYAFGSASAARSCKLPLGCAVAAVTCVLKIAIRGVCAGVLVIASLAFLTCSSWAGAADNLIVNGNLTEGSGVTPEGWQSHQWRAGGSIFNWQPGAGGGQLQIISKDPNDALWVQHLQLGRGWYHFSAQLRSHNVGSKNTGASLCLLQNWVSSQELHGDHDWQTVDFYIKEGGDGAGVDLGCRLGGYGNLNTGEVECRGIEAVAVNAPPAGAGPQYDLATGSVASNPPQAVSDKAATLVLVSAFLVLVAIVWRTRKLRAQKTMLLAERKAADQSAP